MIRINNVDFKCHGSENDLFKRMQSKGMKILGKASVMTYNTYVIKEKHKVMLYDIVPCHDESYAVWLMDLEV